jgi:hypothetical protein
VFLSALAKNVGMKSPKTGIEAVTHVKKKIKGYIARSQRAKIQKAGGMSLSASDR